ncbi:MAG: diguanylate cyclase [Deltaproteobacteria bacterium]|nr:diguanylate cyclase [Deltaproteobacteria bacterium]
MSKIYFLNGPLAGRSFEINAKSLFIGRDTDNDIQIQDPSVSRRHAKIFQKDSKVFIEDLRSQNGTWIDGGALKSGESYELPEGLPAAIGNILICVGEACIKNPVSREYSFDLSWQFATPRDESAENDTLLTDRKKLEQLYQLALEIGHSAGVEETCAKIVDSLLLFLKRIDGGAILMLDEKSRELKEVVSRVRDQAGAGIPLFSRTIVRRVFEQAKAVMISDTWDEGKERFSQSIQLSRIRSIVCVPLLSKAGPIGVLYMHAMHEPQRFQKEDLFFYTALSSLASMAIENALLHSKSQQAEAALEKARADLQIQVQERTAELVKANKMLEDLSITDGLTGLHNYRYLMRVLDTEYKRARRYNHRFALLMLDIDRFKDVNDHYGHPCGDFILQEVGRLLKDCVRNTDIVTRYGGDEMAIILLEVSKALALEVSDKLRREVEKRSFLWQGTTVKITVSIGVAAALEEGIPDWNGLVNAADQALYEAKNGGRNRVIGWTSPAESIES